MIITEKGFIKTKRSAMKKIISVFISAAVLVSYANAQKLHLGAKAGANISKIDGISFEDGYKLGYQVGGWVSLDFGKDGNVGIQPEILYNQSNSQFSSSFKDIYGNILNPGGDETVKLNYLTIPVLLRINVSKLLTLNAGPQFGILINDSQDLIENSKTAFKSGDLSGVLGAQINLGSFHVYGRYGIGLSDNNNLGAPETGTADKWKNQQAQIGIGLKIL